jgi:hypothetical protein
MGTTTRSTLATQVQQMRRVAAPMGSTESAHLSTPPPPPAGLSILQVVPEVVHAVRF